MIALGRRRVRRPAVRQRANPDDAKDDAAKAAERHLVVDQLRGEEAQSEGGDATVQSIGDGGAKAGDEAEFLAIGDGPVNAHHANRTDRRRDDEADGDSLQKKESGVHLRGCRGGTNMPCASYISANPETTAGRFLAATAWPGLYYSP